MNLVTRRTWRERTTFKELPFGAAYWVSTTLNAAPLIKTGRRSSIGGLTTDTLTLTAVSDTSIGVVQLPRFLAVPG